MIRGKIQMMPSNLPKISLTFNRLKEVFLSAEDRVAKMSRRRVVLVVAGLAAGFVLLGVVLGVIFSPYRPTETPPLDPNANRQDQSTSSYTGVVRSLDKAIEGANFYLELEDNQRLLLKSMRIDLSFFKDASVTVEGVVVGAPNQNEQIIFVSKIRIK